MKKLLLCLLAALLVLTVLSACGTKEENADTDEDSGVEIEKEETEEISQETKEAESTKKPTGTVEKTEEPATEKEPTPEEINDLIDANFLYCEFKNKIIPSDYENYIKWYEASDGNVYVSVKFELYNKGDKKLDAKKDHLSAYFTYDGKRYDLSDLVIEDSRCRSLSASASTSKISILPGEKVLVHYFTRVESKAQNDNLVVTYNAFGEKNEVQVKKDSLTYTLQDKNEATVGSTLKISDLYEFQIIECKVKKYITAQDYGNSEQLSYKKLGSDEVVSMIDLVIKAKNHTNDNFDSNDIAVYTMSDDKSVESKHLKMEVENNTDFADLKLGAGKEEYIHLICEAVDSSSGDYIRFNINNTCYYCKVEK